MKKIISFSLWGTDAKYNNGAIINADLALDIYPNWICRYYIGRSTPIETIDQLSQKKNVEIVHMNEDGSWNSMFWRFYPIGDVDTEIMLSRDADSRISLREKICVEEFINSDKLFHNIIDHPFHGGIMGGMWGAKKGILTNIKELINNWKKTDKWQTDQLFLNTVVKPLVSNTFFEHDSINKKNIPLKRIDYEYIGDQFDHVNHRSQHWTVFTQPEFKGL